MACKEKCKHVNISGNLEGGCDHCDSFFKSILLIELRLKINFVFVFSPIITKLGRIVVFKFDYDWMKNKKKIIISQIFCEDILYPNW